MTRARILPPLLALLALTACSGDDLATMSQDKAKQQVQLYAGITLTSSGVAAFSQSAANVTGCPRDGGKLSDPDKTFYIRGSYQMIVPADRQAEVLGKVRDEWQRNGYTIDGTRSDPPGDGGEIRAVTGDAYEMRLAGGVPAMQLLITSPCYRTGS
jgi:hypothetical protein